VPSGIARVVIMASIALGLAEAFKSGVGSNISRGMFLILSYTANIFDKMIIAGASPTSMTPRLPRGRLGPGTFADGINAAGKVIGRSMTRKALPTASS
jgi:hypothetical protein